MQATLPASTWLSPPGGVHLLPPSIGWLPAPSAKAGPTGSASLSRGAAAAEPRSTGSDAAMHSPVVPKSWVAALSSHWAASAAEAPQPLAMEALGSALVRSPGTGQSTVASAQPVGAPVAKLSPAVSVGVDARQMSMGGGVPSSAAPAVASSSAAPHAAVSTAVAPVASSTAASQRAAVAPLSPFPAMPAKPVSAAGKTANPWTATATPGASLQISGTSGAPTARPAAIASSAKPQAAAAAKSSATASSAAASSAGKQTASAVATAQAAAPLRPRSVMSAFKDKEVQELGIAGDVRLLKSGAADAASTLRALEQSAKARLVTGVRGLGTAIETAPGMPQASAARSSAPVPAKTRAAAVPDEVGVSAVRAAVAARRPPASASAPAGGKSAVGASGAKVAGVASTASKGPVTGGAAGKKPGEAKKKAAVRPANASETMHMVASTLATGFKGLARSAVSIDLWAIVRAVLAVLAAVLTAIAGLCRSGLSAIAAADMVTVLASAQHEASLEVAHAADVARSVTGDALAALHGFDPRAAATAARVFADENLASAADLSGQARAAITDAAADAGAVAASLLQTVESVDLAGQASRLQQAAAPQLGAASELAKQAGSQAHEAADALLARATAVNVALEVERLRQSLAPGGSISEGAADALVVARGAAAALVDRVTAADYAGDWQQLWASPPAVELRDGVASVAVGVKAAAEGLVQALADVDVAAEAQRVRGAAAPAFGATLAAAGSASMQLKTAAAELSSQIQHINLATGVAAAQDRLEAVSSAAGSGAGAAVAELESSARGATQSFGEAAAKVDITVVQQQVQAAAAAFASNADAARSQAAAAAVPSVSALQASAAEAAAQLDGAVRRAAEALGHGIAVPSGQRSLDLSGMVEKGAEESIRLASRLVGRVW